MGRMQDWLQRELSARGIFFIAVFVVIGFATGGFLLLQREPLPAIGPEKKQHAEKPGMEEVVPIHGAISAEQVSVLRNPFSRVHEERGQPYHALPESLAVSVPAVTARAVSGGDATDGLPVELKGILLSDTGNSMAVLALSDRQFSLQPGEGKYGVYLVSVQSTGVVIQCAGGERTLTLRQ